MPPCIQVFLWIASLSMMNAMGVLQRSCLYVVISPHICILCMKNVELGDHITIHCDFSIFIWTYFMSKISVFWVMLCHVVDFVCHWNGRFLDPRDKVFWMGILHGVCWGIWKERNKRIFEGVRKSPLEVAESILIEVTSWVTASKDFYGCTLNVLVRDWLSCLYSCLLSCDV